MNVFFTFIFSIISTLVFINPETHEFHLSKSIVNYNSEKQSLQITMNMFIDDLELALQPSAGDTLRICTRKEKEGVEESIHAYILEHLIIEINGEIIIPEFLGKEPSDDLAAVWCYLEVEGISSFSEMSVSNTIMTELFDDQKNMTSVQLNKDRIEDILFTLDRTSDKILMYD